MAVRSFLSVTTASHYEEVGWKAWCGFFAVVSLYCIPIGIVTEFNVLGLACGYVAGVLAAFPLITRGSMALRLLLCLAITLMWFYFVDATSKNPRAKFESVAGTVGQYGSVGHQTHGANKNLPPIYAGTVSVLGSPLGQGSFLAASALAAGNNKQAAE